ncbi:GspH/FimT family pseudopilin [Bacterioplanoides sp.]|uniref:GspH/FimT family pseudopilin n=1 Tax=Bacterioplanoides sp. TaxID=2066072 RepID=UPI003B5BFC0B
MIQVSNLKAFTLVELMIVIAIIGIMMAVATPNLRTYNVNTMADSAHKALLQDIRYGRNTARDIGTNVEIFPQSGDWSQGWIVNEVGGAPLRIHGPVEQAVITSNSYNNQDGSRLTFDERGRASAVGSFQIRTAGCTGDRNRDIAINVMGQTRTTTSACTN